MRTMLQICRCRVDEIVKLKGKSTRSCMWGGRGAIKWMNANMSSERIENRRGHPIREEEDDWWRHEKKNPQKNGSVLTGPRCPEVIVLGDCFADICQPACRTILFFPAVLILRFSWRAQQNPDRHITKGTTGVTLYFRFPFAAWCMTCDNGVFMKLSITCFEKFKLLTTRLMRQWNKDSFVPQYYTVCVIGTGKLSKRPTGQFHPATISSLSKNAFIPYH